jgi:hypothetical protein
VNVGLWLSLVERFVRDEEAASSNLASPTTFKLHVPWGFGGGIRSHPSVNFDAERSRASERRLSLHIFGANMPPSAILLV